MLSHLVGTSNRADIVRVRELEARLAESDEKIARQEGRLHRLGRERDEQNRRIEELEQAMKQRPAPVPANDPDAPNAMALKQRLDVEQARSARLMTCIAEQDQALAAQTEQIQTLETQAAELRRELTSLEATLADLMGVSENETEVAPDLAGKCLLYVGGRPRQLGQIRAVVRELGGTLLTHDGGVEESTSLLPNLVGQADLAFFPVDCVSHRAMGQVKRYCRDAGKRSLAFLDRISQTADAES
jgi:hypothetical protein